MSIQRDTNHGVARMKPKILVFGGLFAIAYSLALLPPVYIWASGRHGIVLGLPASLWYMFGVCIFAVGICGGLYAYELNRKELD
jgi:hypothetical protein